MPKMQDLILEMSDFMHLSDNCRHLKDGCLGSKRHDGSLESRGTPRGWRRTSTRTLHGVSALLVTHGPFTAAQQSEMHGGMKNRALPHIIFDCFLWVRRTVTGPFLSTVCCALEPHQLTPVMSCAQWGRKWHTIVFPWLQTQNTDELPMIWLPVCSCVAYSRCWVAQAVAVCVVCFSQLENFYVYAHHHPTLTTHSLHIL